jgi:hypothetical protein
MDLLLMLDNSRSMADKQQILAAAVPDIVNQLVNPACLDNNGVPVNPQPQGPLEPCATGGHREFSPIVDLHIGVITSSLGGHGADACNPAKQGPTNDDHGELVSRINAQQGAAKVPTYQDKGFLAWDPAHKLSPPGEQDIQLLAKHFSDITIGVDQVGCGYESQLESWYRFLAEPDPYDTISVQGGEALPMGIDTKLLAQRSDFLRSDSLLAIVMLSDENDCSTREYGQFWYAGQLQDPNNPGKNFHLPGSRAICKTSPNDPCCKSCGQADGECGPDPTCLNPLPALDDDLNLRCYHQKERFGIDFLYPTDRYISALTTETVANRKGELVPNPIFSLLNPNAGTPVRNSSLVYLMGIVGVPWQDLALDPHDLGKGYKSAAQLSEKDASGHTTWDVVIGDPLSNVAPLDPLMIESVAPRSGISPIVGVPLGAAGQGTPLTNPANGKEYDIPRKDDLQYACVFDLPNARDCTVKNAGCDCTPPAQGEPASDSPVCNGTNQVKAKAYPGIRELSVLRGLSDHGIATSICPANSLDPAAANFGYRQNLRALVDSIRPGLPK